MSREVQLATLRVRFEHDVVIARQRAGEAARLLGVGTQRRTRLATVVSELARRAFRAGEHGWVAFDVVDRRGHGLLRVRIRHPRVDPDSPDVRGLEEVLDDARRLVDVVESQEEDGVTYVTVGQYLPDDAPAPGDADMDEVVTRFRDHDPSNPFEELQQRNEELIETMAKLRERERERSRLLEAERRAREEAQRAVESREEILSIVSHDLRNPIGAIETGARFLLEQPELLGEEGVGPKQLRAIVRSAERANRLIQDLLDVSSIEQGELSIEPAPEEPARILEELRELMEPRASDAGITLRIDGAASLPWIRADRDRIVQALANLVANAIRFTPEGGTVTVEADRVVREGEGEAVRFGVRDTGPGVPEEDREHLFERFWTDGGSGGAGLGLAIVRGIAESHGGRAWHDPGVAEGACFRVTVPVSAGGSGPSRPDAPGRDAEGPEPG